MHTLACAAVATIKLLNTNSAVTGIIIIIVGTLHDNCSIERQMNWACVHSIIIVKLATEIIIQQYL